MPDHLSDRDDMSKFVEALQLITVQIVVQEWFPFAIRFRDTE